MVLNKEIYVQAKHDFEKTKPNQNPIAAQSMSVGQISILANTFW